MPTTAPERNRLLAALPRHERKRFVACSRPVHLARADVLSVSGARIRHAYFPLDGCISLSTRSMGDSPLEIGLVGNEGMLGVDLVLDVASSARVAVVQGEGLSLRVDSALFRHELLACPVLARTVKRYVNVLMDQLAHYATCTRFHVVTARLARLLLMTQDRAATQPLRLTHEALAARLGVRRAGITAAASTLQVQGFIAYHRGEISVLDRAGLKAAACNCYAADNETYARIMGDRPIQPQRRTANPRA